MILMSYRFVYALFIFFPVCLWCFSIYWTIAEKCKDSINCMLISLIHSTNSEFKFNENTNNNKKKNDTSSELKLIEIKLQLLVEHLFCIYSFYVMPLYAHWACKANLIQCLTFNKQRYFIFNNIQRELMIQICFDLND